MFLPKGLFIPFAFTKGNIKMHFICSIFLNAASWIPNHPDKFEIVFSISFIIKNKIIRLLNSNPRSASTVIP